LKALLKCGDARTNIGIAFGDRHQHAHAANSFRLLSARRERPCDCRAAEQRYEVASFHCPMSPVLPTKRIAHLSYGRRSLRCESSIQLTSVQGQTRPRSHVRVAAALPPTTAVVLQRRERQFRAIAGLMHRSKRHHSITSSARSRIDVGNSIPIAFAVLRLTTISNFVTCSTGRSAGVAPRRILAT